MSALAESLGSTFFHRALVEALLVGALAGVTGVHVLLRRLPFFVVAMSHATFPGLALAAALGVSAFLGGFAAAAGVIVAIVLVRREGVIDSSSAIGVVLAGSFAIGLLISATASGVDRKVTGFLVGSILSVDTAEVMTTAILGVAVALVLAALHKELVLSAFDRAGSEALGYRTRLLDVCLLTIVAAVVIAVTPAVGTLLAVALLTIPAMTARLWHDRVAPMMVVAGFTGALSGVGGLLVSAVWPVAPGGAIALFAVALFAVSFAVRVPRRSATA